MPITLLEIDVGSAPGDKTGDPGRTSFEKVNYNFALIAGALPDAELKAFVVGCTAPEVDLEVKTKVEYFRMPYSFVLLDASACVDVAPEGDDIVLDILENGYSVLDTSGLIIPAGSETSLDSTIQPVIAPSFILERDNKVSIDVLNIGSTTPGQWLKVTLHGFVSWTSY